MAQVLGKGKVARIQRCRARRVEGSGLFRLEARVGQEIRVAIDAISAQLALVEALRLHVFDRNAQLEELRLVALQLALGVGARPAVLVGEQLAQLGERHRLARVEQKRDEIQQALRLLHQSGAPSSAHWMAATLSSGISTCLPLSGPSSLPITI
jgi:hypothetical protein